MAAIFFLLWIIPTVAPCELGLTQLRHRETLALMRCVPTMPGQADPCIVQTGGRMAVCQKYGQDYVCCGSQELLVQLLAGRPANERFEPGHSIVPFQRVVSEWWNNGQHFDYNVIRNAPSSVQKETSMVITTPQSSPFPSRTTLQPRRLSLSTPSPLSTLLYTLDEPYITEGNYTHSIRTSSNVIAIRDGRCTIVVNTGMPHQKVDIIKNLASSGIRASDVHFVVITQAHPQFLGNLNLFPDAQVVMERFFIFRDNVIRGGIDPDVHVELCSSNTYVVSSAGPTSNSVSLIARNVPSMGTVAITGTLFVANDSLISVDEDFTVNTIQLLQSRAEIVCQSDWILPAHSPAFPVTSTMRRTANCS